MLRRAGAEVTLVDAWGPGHARASSGGETRVIRGTYGDRAIYTQMAARAMELWTTHDARSGRHFFHRVGALWLFSGDPAFGEASVEPMRASGLAVEWIDPADAARRWPQMSFDGVTHALWEPGAGYALARRACEHVVEALVAEGGISITGRAASHAGGTSPVDDTTGRLRTLHLADGQTLHADHFVFACGPWLGTLFPDVVGSRIRPSRQESFYFGTPAGDVRWLPPAMPVWLDYAERMVYGIPGNAQRGFKFADDTYGATFDPTHGDRSHTPEMLGEARTFLRRRFPALADAPLLGSEVCQYELTADSHFLVDRHPHADNVWLVGGGSGHGFKMGPALGEHVANLVLGAGEPEPLFALARR